MLSDLEDEVDALVADLDARLEGVVDAGDGVVGELDVDHGTRDASDAPDAGSRLYSDWRGSGVSHWLLSLY
ncbi:hypothetical protein GCM10022256_06660 [Frondihabitans peucedani]|uniref:Uncharacterized protein n=1 Tax=Frondihabitans peucedani TaxID=598626 RepID=A0ABP8DYQ5_9MICO